MSRERHQERTSGLGGRGVCLHPRRGRVAELFLDLVIGIPWLATTFLSKTSNLVEELLHVDLSHTRLAVHHKRKVAFGGNDDVGLAYRQESAAWASLAAFTDRSTLSA